jgi:hypothetical protein
MFGLYVMIFQRLQPGTAHPLWLSLKIATHPAFGLAAMITRSSISSCMNVSAFAPSPRSALASPLVDPAAKFILLLHKTEHLPNNFTCGWKPSIGVRGLMVNNVSKSGCLVQRHARH